MSKKEFIELVKYIKPKLDIYTRTTPYDNLSFFEVVEAIGFVHFARKKAKWVVLEAGCGGRYDSSNVVPHKDIAIITNIGLDHKGIIGKNKQEIAYEKAGIIQHNSYVLSGERNKKIREVIGKEAKKKNCKIEYADDGYEIQKHSLNGISFRHKNKDYSLAVLGEHQIQNAILAIQAAEHLKIKEKDIKNGLKKTRLPLRMEVVSKNPLIILDSAHNPDKIKSTVNTINQINLENINLIVGFSEDKEVDKMVKQLSTLNLKTIACTRYIKNPLRLTADPKTLGSKSKKLLPKRKIEIFLDPQTAMQWTRTKTKTNDLILVTGSIFLAGELISR